MSFKENFSFICEQSKDLINNFVESNKGIIYEQLGVDTINDVSKLLTPYEVLFFQNGKYAIIFATKWSEEEMCILCDGNNIKVDEGYILRYEI
jgi:hypothetical protein